MTRKDHVSRRLRVPHAQGGEQRTEEGDAGRVNGAQFS